MVMAAGVWINQISIFLLLLPLYMLTTGLFAVGVGWIVASLHVFLRDTAQVLSVILTFWFWATPIFIEEGKFPKSARFLLHANPMYYAVRSYRAILLHSTMPSFQDLGDVSSLRSSRFCGWRLVLPLHESADSPTFSDGDSNRGVAPSGGLVGGVNLGRARVHDSLLIEVPPMESTPAVTITTKVIISVYSIKS